MLNNQIIIWGVGYLGFSNLISYAQKDQNCIGVDVLSDIKQRIISGKYKEDLLAWMSCDVKELFTKYNVDIVTDLRQITLAEKHTHIICVPTEKGGDPWNGAIYDVVDQIVSIEKDSGRVNVLIESTLIPGTAEMILKKIQNRLPKSEILFCVAPRRDWFTTDGKNLQNIKRVYGVNSQRAKEHFEGILSIVCDQLVYASDYKYAEMCKSVENSIRHVNIMLANQLADAFPTMDIREVLALAGTKWNIETYRPSFGPGGYCIPVSSKYIVSALYARKPLSILQETITYTSQRPMQIVRHIEQRCASRDLKIGVMGLTYEADIKVDIGAPIKEIVFQFINDGYDLYLNDPNYSDAEIVNKYNVGILKQIDDIKHIDVLLLNIPHKEYLAYDWNSIISLMKRGILVFDNTGLLDMYKEAINAKGCYYLIGTPSWNN